MFCTPTWHNLAGRSKKWIDIDKNSWPLIKNIQNPLLYAVSFYSVYHRNIIVETQVIEMDKKGGSVQRVLNDL
jgi:hypothetical protein